MNRRDLLKSSATLAAAVVGCTPQEKKPVVNSAIRLSDDCHVEVFYPEDYRFNQTSFPREDGWYIHRWDIKGRVENVSVCFK